MLKIKLKLNSTQFKLKLNKNSFNIDLKILYTKVCSKITIQLILNDHICNFFVSRFPNNSVAVTFLFLIPKKSSQKLHRLEFLRSFNKENKN